MFEKHLPTDINVYAITSSRYNELSWMCTHDTYRKTYLGNNFINNKNNLFNYVNFNFKMLRRLVWRELAV